MHDRRGLDRRARVEPPEQPSVSAAPHIDVPVHPVDDHQLPVDRGRGGELDVRCRAPPEELAVAHRERADRPDLVADVRDTVVDDRRELDQPARRLAPDDPERRAQPDRRLCLRSGGRGAVERPLQRALVDLDAHPRVIAELDPLGQGVVAALRDGDAQLAALAERDQRPAFAVRPGVEAADADDGAADARAQVAVDDADLDRVRVPRAGGGPGATLAGPERAARRQPSNEAEQRGAEDDPSTHAGGG